MRLTVTHRGAARLAETRLVKRGVGFDLDAVYDALWHRGVVILGDRSARAMEWRQERVGVAVVRKVGRREDHQATK